MTPPPIARRRVTGAASTTTTYTPDASETGSLARRATSATTGRYTNYVDVQYTEPWNTPSSCSTNIYKGFDGEFTAWDPRFSRDYDTKATDCHATQVTRWLDQSGTTAIAMGTSFRCPYNYKLVNDPTSSPASATSTSTANVAEMQLRLCCPSNYIYNSTATRASDFRPGYFSSQCYSTVNPGQTLSYMTLPSTPSPSSTTTSNRLSVQVSAISEVITVPPSTTLTVYGVPVNGFYRREPTSTQMPRLLPTNYHGPGNLSPEYQARLIGGTLGGVFGFLLLWACFEAWRANRAEISAERAANPPPPNPGETETNNTAAQVIEMDTSAVPAMSGNTALELDSAGCQITELESAHVPARPVNAVELESPRDTTAPPRASLPE